MKVSPSDILGGKNTVAPGRQELNNLPHTPFIFIYYMYVYIYYIYICLRVCVCVLSQIKGEQPALAAALLPRLEELSSSFCHNVVTCYIVLHY